MSGIQEPWRKSKWSTIVVCNKYCPGRKRARPSLQCIQCKSFFHPECIFFNAKDAKKIKNTFTCTKCHLASDPNALKIRIRTVDLCPVVKLSFDCLLGIFSFLSLTDLQSVARVCLTWKYVAAQPVLWKRVSFNCVLVKDWALAEKCLVMSSVQRLDFRGMVFAEKKSANTWHKITDLLHNMEYLKYLDFGRVPAGVLHDIVGSLSSLEVLTAEWIIDVVRESKDIDREKTARIDVGKFSHLKNLKELRLRAACAGLQLPMFAFSAGMNGLKELKQLQKLALTTFRHLTAQDFQFLSSLEQLQDLELGDCLDWETETMSETSTYYGFHRTVERVKIFVCLLAVKLAYLLTRLHLHVDNSNFKQLINFDGNYNLEPDWLFKIRIDNGYLKFMNCAKLSKLQEISFVNEEKTYESLGKLTELRHLRLERAGSISDEGLVRGLSSLKNLVHLELIMCEVPETFSRALMEISSLRTLCIWPDTFSEHARKVNTNCLAAIVGLQHLQLLDWGVLTTEYEKSNDIVKNYTSYCNTQAKHYGPTVEFSKSVKEVLSNNIPEFEYVQNVSSENILMSGAQLRKIVTENLPSTYVRVLPVPVNFMERLYFVI